MFVVVFVVNVVGVCFGYVEVGFCVNDWWMFEEYNCVMVDYIVDDLFVVMEVNRVNFFVEGIVDECIFVIGNFVVEVVWLQCVVVCVDGDEFV